MKISRVHVVNRIQRAVLSFAALVFGAALLAGRECAADSVDGAARPDFWSEDVWRRPDRPFLFYGRQLREKSADKAEAKPQGLTPARERDAARELTAIESIEELRAEVRRRLDRAVMRPSRESVALYLQANAFLMQKAGTFAAVWRDELLSHPQYDWTAQHPTVNAASTALSRSAEAGVEESLAAMREDWGFVFFADNSELTRLMAPIVRDFAARRRFETVWVSVDVETAAWRGVVPEVEVKTERTLAARTAHGLRLFPALVMVHRADKGLEDARLIATGVVGQAEIARRAARAASMPEAPEAEAHWTGFGPAERLRPPASPQSAGDPGEGVRRESTDLF